MNSKRITHLKIGSTDRTGKYVLYWMQQSQRVHYNHALEHAIQIANAKQLPVLVYFGLTARYPEANLRHYTFMLEGLIEVKSTLEKFDISFVLRMDSPEKGILNLLKDAYFLVMDYGYLNIQKQWRTSVVDVANEHYPHLFIDQVETDVIVPVEVVSQKVEYGAYTLRPKIKKIFQEYRDFTRLTSIINKTHIELDSDDHLLDINQTLSRLDLDQSILPSPIYKGGFLEASKLFFEFLNEKADHYLESSDPSTNYTSKMSMYLHFGQISSLDLLERMFTALNQGHIDGQVFDAYIEQLLVRRELAFNFVTYQSRYDQFEHMTEPWAYMSMNEHAFDKRPYLYSQKQIENSQTHDPYFNAAMKEMFHTGFMHNYMRMYWAKKIIEWMPTYKEAYETIKYLNNTYFIDGRDPNSYAGIAWCFGKHDRAWTERLVFGKLRYMNDKGLERKFNIKAYVHHIEMIEKAFFTCEKT